MRFRRRSIYMAALILLLVVSGAGLISELLRMQEAEQLREDSAQRSSALHVNLESFFREQADALAVMMALYRDNKIHSQADFSYYAGQVFALVPGLRTISATNPDYMLVYQFPSGNLAHNLNLFHDRVPYANRARDERLITVTAPLLLATDRRPGFAMYVPAYFESRFRGLIIGTFELDQLVDRHLRPILKSVPFVLKTEDGAVFYKSGEMKQDPALYQTTTVKIAQTNWIICWEQEQPNAAFLQYRRSIALVTAVLLGSIMLLILYFFQTHKLDMQQHTLEVFEQNCQRIEKQFQDKLQENAVLYRQLESTQGDLLRATKMAALGEVTAVLAHEIRNPLTALMNCIETLKRANRRSDEMALLEMSLKETVRLEHIVSDCLNFARHKQPVLEDVDLYLLVSGVVEAFRKDSRWKKRTRIQLLECDEDVIIRSDPEQLRQVLWNVLINSAQAITKLGDIVIQCGINAEQNQAVVRITDTGEGISPEAQARIFEPFFSTKPSGIGLGLFIVKRIMEDHGGSITLESERNHGTTVTIHLPTVKEIVSHVALANYR